MWPAVWYIPYTTSYHEQTGDIITFAQVEEGSLVENESGVEKDESVSDSLGESSTEDDSGD